MFKIIKLVLLKILIKMKIGKIQTILKKASFHSLIFMAFESKTTFSNPTGFGCINNSDLVLEFIHFLKKY